MKYFPIYYEISLFGWHLCVSNSVEEQTAFYKSKKKYAHHVWDRKILLEVSMRRDALYFNRRICLIQRDDNETCRTKRLWSSCCCITNFSGDLHNSGKSGTVWNGRFPFASIITPKNCMIVIYSSRFSIM